MNEDHRMQYYFFVTTIASKCNTFYNRDYFFNIAKEVLKNYKKYLKYNEHLLERAMEKKGLMRMMSAKKTMKTQDALKHILKSEDDIIGIIKISEPLST